ncbi:hypothetical protein P167DRAFT_534129 [Morchella conica CCBAS932]|uniref:Uncharacterized protein n=1 Tax=Morchella conica CCBAS932 TaxID=1392247 RepID=A0A3N4KUT2_9PEZI|nr:hypothetical protein P167DRAFT_534129 [Morchella conica CCBAS932]
MGNLKRADISRTYVEEREKERERERERERGKETGGSGGAGGKKTNTTAQTDY